MRPFLNKVIKNLKMFLIFLINWLMLSLLICHLERERSAGYNIFIVNI
jgi:hypothetical protein